MIEKDRQIALPIFLMLHLWKIDMSFVLRYLPFFFEAGGLVLKQKWRQPFFLYEMALSKSHFHPL
jgi:hypothetical protein